MPTYELKSGCGKHQLTHVINGKKKLVVVSPGQAIESNRPLDELFPNKFVNTDKKPAQEQAEVIRDGGGQENSNQEDVTDQFENAADVGLSVFKVGRKYIVVDSDGEPQTKEPVNKAGATAVIDDAVEASME